jgi:hypothetical protein
VGGMLLSHPQGASISARLAMPRLGVADGLLARRRAYCPTGSTKLAFDLGRGGRVAEGTRLLSEYGAEHSIAGSNPALSVSAEPLE